MPNEIQNVECLTVEVFTHGNVPNIPADGSLKVEVPLNLLALAGDEISEGQEYISVLGSDASGAHPAFLKSLMAVGQALAKGELLFVRAPTHEADRRDTIATRNGWSIRLSNGSSGTEEGESARHQDGGARKSPAGLGAGQESSEVHQAPSTVARAMRGGAAEEVEELEAALIDAQSSLRQRFQELAMLTKYLKEAEDAGLAAADQQAWLVESYAVLEQQPKWWSFLPSGMRRRREHRLLKRANLFDAEKYLEQYPDVAADGMDPVRHYVLHGMAEGRQCVR